MRISVIIPTLNEKENLIQLIPKLHHLLPQLVPQSEYEIILVDGGSTDGTTELANQLAVRLVQQKSPGYGGALKTGFEQARGAWIFTLDADLSHDPGFFQSLWEKRDEAEVIIASRYIPGGKATMPVSRIILSRILNYVFSRGLSLPVKDMSSGFRLYRKTALTKIKAQLVSRNFDVLEEILIRAYAEGWKIQEVPFHYYPRYTGRTHAKLVKFGLAFMRTFYRMWKLRNSIQSADYDTRAYDSIIPLQRYWQRKRVGIITQFISDFAPHINYVRGRLRILDVGCGSSRLISDSQEMVGVDIQINKLRYLKQQNSTLPLVQATIDQLPFRNEQFPGVICSQVIEHLSENTIWFDEINRVLKPNGKLILGTPDYSQRNWRVIEYLYKLLVPSGYADEHITQYTLTDLQELLSKNKFILLDKRYICNAELILIAKKLEYIQ
ncbi:MAG: glycosyltransferase [bacterium]|nr:glycosyltransferase [bacterium]